MKDLYKLEKRIDMEIKQFETLRLPKLRNLGLTPDIINTTSVLGEVKTDIDSVWSSCNVAFIDKCNELGIPGARDMKFFYYYDELDEIHDLIWDTDQLLTEAINTGAGQNYREYKSGLYDIEHPKTYGGARYGVITNSFGTVLAAEFLRGFTKAISDTVDEIGVSNSYNDKQRKLINAINQTWYNMFDTKLKPLILEADKKMKVAIMENIAPKFGCTIEEYEEWKKANIKPKQNVKKDYSFAIQEVEEIIKKNQDEISTLGSWPFGEKARKRKALTKENELLERELYSLKHPKEINDMFTTFSITCRAASMGSVKTYFDHEFDLKYNPLDNLYHVIVHTNSGEVEITSFTRDFTIMYGRSRKIYGETNGGSTETVGNYGSGLYKVTYNICLNEE